MLTCIAKMTKINDSQRYGTNTLKNCQYLPKWNICIPYGVSVMLDSNKNEHMFRQKIRTRGYGGSTHHSHKLEATQVSISTLKESGILYGNENKRYYNLCLYIEKTLLRK